MLYFQGRVFSEGEGVKGVSFVLFSDERKKHVSAFLFVPKWGLKWNVETNKNVAYTSIGKRPAGLGLKGLLVSYCSICTTQEVIHCDKSDLPGFQLRDGLKEIICFVPSDTDGSFRFPAVPNGKFKVVSIFPAYHVEKPVHSLPPPPSPSPPYMVMLRDFYGKFTGRDFWEISGNVHEKSHNMTIQDKGHFTPAVPMPNGSFTIPETDSGTDSD